MAPFSDPLLFGETAEAAHYLGLVEAQAQAYKGAVPPGSALVLRDELGTGFCQVIISKFF